MRKMDKDGSMTIDFHEFVQFISPRLLESEQAKQDVEDQYLAFADWCKTHNETLGEVRAFDQTAPRVCSH